MAGRTDGKHLRCIWSLLISSNNVTQSFVFYCSIGKRVPPFFFLPACLNEFKPHIFLSEMSQIFSFNIFRWGTVVDGLGVQPMNWLCFSCKISSSYYCTLLPSNMLNGDCIGMVLLSEPEVGLLFPILSLEWSRDESSHHVSEFWNQQVVPFSVYFIFTRFLRRWLWGNGCVLNTHIVVLYKVIETFFYLSYAFFFVICIYLPHKKEWDWFLRDYFIRFIYLSQNSF